MAEKYHNGRKIVKYVPYQWGAYGSVCLFVFYSRTCYLQIRSR